MLFLNGERQENAFNFLMNKLSNTPSFVLPGFDKTFEIRCDASSLGIRALIIQDGKPMYFCEKLNEGALNYPTYDKELFALVHIWKV